eukprot:PhF_6_TR31359/c5_g1_i1/m.45891
MSYQNFQAFPQFCVPIGQPQFVTVPQSQVQTQKPLTPGQQQQQPQQQQQVIYTTQPTYIQQGVPQYGIPNSQVQYIIPSNTPTVQYVMVAPTTQSPQGGPLLMSAPPQQTQTLFTMHPPLSLSSNISFVGDVSRGSSFPSVPSVDMFRGTDEFGMPFSEENHNHKNRVRRLAPVLSDDERVAVRNGTAPKPVVTGLTCFHCGEDGHKACRCPKNPNAKVAPTALCVIHGKPRTFINLQPHKDLPGEYECIPSNPCLCKVLDGEEEM